MYFSVCLGALFPKDPALQAMEKIRRAGLSHYEFWSWWDKDMDEYLAAQRATGLTPTALCTRFISLTDPSCRADYIKGVEETVAVCKKLGCSTIISQVGKELPGVPRPAQQESIIEGLRACVPILKENDITLVIEPLNTRVNHPGYYLWQCEEAFHIVRSVGDRHVKVLVDLYHQHVMDDLDMDEIIRNLAWVGHFHMAGAPGRHEPLESDMDYPDLLCQLEQAGYKGSVGLEYFPARDAEEGLQNLCSVLHAR